MPQMIKTIFKKIKSFFDADYIDLNFKGFSNSVRTTDIKLPPPVPLKDNKIYYKINPNFRGFSNPSQTIDMDTKIDKPTPLFNKNNK